MYRILKVTTWFGIITMLVGLAALPVLDDLLSAGYEIQSGVEAQRKTIRGIDADSVAEGRNPTGAEHVAEATGFLHTMKTNPIYRYGLLGAATTMVVYGAISRRLQDRRDNARFRRPKAKKTRQRRRVVRIAHTEVIESVGILALGEPIVAPPMSEVPAIPLVPLRPAPQPLTRPVGPSHLHGSRSSSGPMLRTAAGAGYSTAPRSAMTPPVMPTNTPGSIPNTSRGVPAAAQTDS